MAGQQSVTFSYLLLCWISIVDVVSCEDWKCQEEQVECVCLLVDWWYCNAGGRRNGVTICPVCGTILSSNDFFSVNS